MSALKVIGISLGVVAVAVAVCYVVGRAIIGPESTKETAETPPTEATDEPAPGTVDMTPVDTAVETSSETTKDNVVNDAAAMEEAISQATDAADGQRDRIDKVGQLVKMGLHHTDASDERINEVELAYLALVKALHSGKIKGTVWRGGALAPEDADVVELRGRIMDTMTALREPWTYFESENPDLVIAYQYTTHKRPILILQLGGLQYVMASDANRFMTSIPDPDSLGCDPHGYLLVALQCAMEKYDLDMKVPE
jgi:hypothetical protein